MEDQAAGLSAQFGVAAVVILVTARVCILRSRSDEVAGVTRRSLTGGAAVLDAVLAEERNVLALVDLDTSDLHDAVASLTRRTLSIAIHEAVVTNLLDQRVVLSCVQNAHTPVAADTLLVHRSCGVVEGIDQAGCGISIGFVGGRTNTNLSTAGLFEVGFGDRRSLTCTTGDSTEDQTIVFFCKCITDLTGDLRAQLVMSQSLIERVHKCTGDEKIINGDSLLSHRRCTITVTKNCVPGGVVFSRSTTGVNELKALAILQRTLHDEVTGDCIVLEAFEHLSTEQLQIESAGIRPAIVCTRPCKARGESRRLMCHFTGIKLKKYLRLSNVQENFLWSIPTV